MNILFVESYISPTNGGVQRVSWILRDFFENNGHSCFFAYTMDDENELDPSKKLKINWNRRFWDIRGKLLDKKQFKDFVLFNDIDIIILQHLYMPNLFGLYKELKKKHGLKIIATTHITPMLYYAKSKKSTYMKIKDVYCRIIHGKLYQDNNMTNLYSIVDRWIMLSESYIMPFSKVFSFPDITKFAAIPNPLSFSYLLPINDIDNKNNVVLIISRLDEANKNLRSALRIWKNIENSGITNWTLRLGGHGDDEAMILSYAKQLGLQQFEFLGKVEDPQEEYKKAKLFMMTSKFEGFGMTLLESLQNAVVPIVFDTFSAVHDIIDDGYNGHIIPDCNEDLFTNRLLSLMTEKDKLSKMQTNALVSRKRFTIDSIGQKWTDLLESL